MKGAPSRSPSPPPITVASTPIIGDYKLPSLDILHLPDPTVRPTETKEELMANAKLMQNTLAQFQIESGIRARFVSVGAVAVPPSLGRGVRRRPDWCGQGHLDRRRRRGRVCRNSLPDKYAVPADAPPQVALLPHDR